MGFPGPVREEALVRSARRCCVCRMYKGLGIEVHHIEAEAAGGPNTLDNAIALCFDCHAAAGHYNAKHPRGTRFKPSELRRHRDKHWDDVASGRIFTVPEAIAGNIHFRHVICLGYDEASAALEGRFANEHFSLDRIVQTPVSAFMERVLLDDLPDPQNSLVRGGLATPGFVSVEGYWETRADLIAEYPEFRKARSRPIEPRDLESGAIQSKLLSSCVAAGLPAADLGTLKAHHNFCGEECWYVEYRVRRPLFVFTEIQNLGSTAITVLAIKGAVETPEGPAPRSLILNPERYESLAAPPILLEPGQSMTVPVAVILSPPEEDDFSFEWVDNHDVRDRVDFTAFTAEKARLGEDAYRLVGPSFFVSSLEVLAGDAPGAVQGRPFDIRRVYLLGHGWLAGSCPHAVVEFANGELLHLGEILSGAWRETSTHNLTMPPDAVRLHICELEFETTTIRSILAANIQAIGRDVVLQRGETVAIPVRGGDLVTIIGDYDSVLQNPENAMQRRVKDSLVAGGLRVLAAYAEDNRA